MQIQSSKYPVLFATVMFVSQTVYAAEEFSYDFDNYVPTLDQRYSLKDNDPYKTGINADYNLSFVQVETNDAGDPPDNYDFVSYLINPDLTTTPVYYKTEYAIDEKKGNGEEQLRITTNQQGADIIGYFNGQYSTVYASPGGAVFNYSNREIGDIIGDFINNYVRASAGAYGGAIANGGISFSTMYGTVNNIIGDFISNYAEQTGSNGQAAGGAVMNMMGEIASISGNFINNHVKGVQALGGAIANTGNIDSIEGTFIGNYARGTNTRGGAIYNTTTTRVDTGEEINDSSLIPLIKGTFIGNYGYGTIDAIGGAISNLNDKTMAPDIYGLFIGNYVESPQNARSGAIDAPAGINTITGSFINNYAKAGNTAYGGVAYIGDDIRFVADGMNNYFIGNYTEDSRGKIYNALFIASDTGADLIFDITGGGNLYFNDNIAGHDGDAYRYNIDIKGYQTGKFFMNNYIINAGDVNVEDAMLIFNKAPYTDDAGCGDNCHGMFAANFESDNKTPDITSNPVTNLMLNNAQFYLYNNYTETVRLKNYTAAGNSLLHIDVMRENNEWVADKLYISGEIAGDTQVVVYDKTNVDNRNASVLFIEAPNDPGNKNLSVFRVYGSPYKWDIAYNYRGETSGSYWYLIGTNEKNDDKYVGFVPDPIDINDPFDLPEPTEKTPEVTAEIIAYQGLQAAALEQTRSMTGNIRNKVAANKMLPDPCLQVIDEYFEYEPLYNAWVNPVYHTADIKSPVKTDVNIWGLEAGIDVQHNLNHKLGIFASYRNGNYDLSGKGKYYTSAVGSEIDIDSYIGGLYYRYDYRHLWVFATLYGGIQNADIKTDDGVKSDTDGIELGGSIESGYLFNLSDTLKLEPSIGIVYTQIDFDDIKDNYGKSASFDTIRQTELSAGVKLEKYLWFDDALAKVYIKPSILQVMVSGDKTTITGLRTISTYKDGTLGRIEVGGRYSMTDYLSAYGWANYTFGSDYDATSLGLGISYNW